MDLLFILIKTTTKKLRRKEKRKKKLGARIFAPEGNNELSKKKMRIKSKDFGPC